MASSRAPATDPPTPAQVRMLKRLAAHNVRYQHAQSRIDELWRERPQLYLAARALDPPLTFRQIGQVFGISEAAVQQMHDRAKRALALAVEG